MLTRAFRFLVNDQRRDGAWLPLWFGNEHAERHENPTLGTGRVLLALAEARARLPADAITAAENAATWLRTSQNSDGGWGGRHGLPSTVEETGVALSGLVAWAGHDDAARHGAQWLVDRVESGQLASAPIGLYFASLWYFEDLDPLVLALDALRRCS